MWSYQSMAHGADSLMYFRYRGATKGAEQFCYGVLDGADSAYVDDSQLWKNLPAVKAGRLMPYEQVAFMHRDPITLTNQLQVFTDFFRAHADAAA